MGHSRADKAESHHRIVRMAAARFRETGVDGVGVADLMKDAGLTHGDRKSTRLNSSHANISYAVFCLKKKNRKKIPLHGKRQTSSIPQLQSTTEEGPRFTSTGLQRPQPEARRGAHPVARDSDADPPCG